MPEKWLSYACLYIYCHSIKTIRLTEILLTSKIVSELKVADQKNWVSKGRHLLYGHNSTILAPINFYLMPFYSSHASNSNGITWHKITAKNKYYMALIPPHHNMQGSLLCVKWVPVYIRTYFILQESLFNKRSFDI